MANVSRLELDHPALGTTGGAALHTQIEALYKKLGDALATRWYQLTDFDNGETVDLDHNFEMEIELLRYDIYVYTGGTWVKVTADSSPALSDFTVVEKTGEEDTVLQITNVSGGNDLLVAVVINNDPLYLSEGDIEDVDVSGAEEGQALVYESSTKKFIPGASGDSSFKVQSVAADGTIVIKGGYLIDDSGVEYATYDGSGSASTDYGTDLTFDLDTLVPSPSNDTTYYLYIDKQLLSDAVTLTNNGRTLVGVTASHLVAVTTKPTTMILERYIPIGFARYATGAWSTTLFGTLAFRRHQSPSVNVSPLVQTFGPTAIGTVGAAGNYAGGHLKDADSYRSSLTTSTLSIYALAANANDSIGTRNFTNNNSTPFTGTDIRGTTNAAAALTAGSSHSFSYTADNFFNGGDADFTADIWAALTDWTPGTDMVLMSNEASSTDRGWTILVQTTGDIVFQYPITSSTVGNFRLSNPGFVDGSYHHFAMRYNATLNTWAGFVDGVPVDSFVQANIAASANIMRLGAFRSTPTNFLTGRLGQFGYAKALLSDLEILKLASVRLDLAQSVAKENQIWEGQYIDANGLRSELPKSWLVDQKDTKVYVNLGDSSVSTDSILLKLHDGGIGATTVPVRTFDRTYTSSPGSSVTHGLPDLPTHVRILHNANADGKWVDISGDAQAKATTTAIEFDLTSYTIDGTHPIRIVASVGVPALGIGEATALSNGIISTGNQTLGGRKSAGNSKVIASRTSDQNISSSATKFQLNVEDLDSNSEYDPTTNFRLTPTRSGYWMVTASVRGENINASNYFEVYIYKNGAMYKRSGIRVANTTGGTENCFASVSALVDVNGTTDYIEIFILSQSAKNFQGSMQAFEII
jgi:hypothetical protein